MRRHPHSTYYRDRASEYDLCNDFPGDVILIDGLHAMQNHFRNNNVAIDIPVVRVMNTAHYIASYMFSTECSGDQMEYDVLAYDSFGRDKQLGAISMIVLAAMLKRTEGFRARQCRNMLLENRDPDFEEGVSLYDRFLRSAEKHFAEEDFLIDTQQLIKQVNEQKEIIAQQNKEISSLKYTITTMAGQKPQTIVYNYGTFNDIHDNPNATIYACPETSNTEEVKPVESSSVSPESDSGSSSGAPDNSSENNSSSNSPKFNSGNTRGRKTQRLFVDEQTAEQEKNRLLNFLHLHNLGSREFDSSEDSSVNQIAACFYRQWAKRELLDEKAGGTAYVRFLKNDCKLPISVLEKALANVLSRMIFGNDKYPNWSGEISAYFQY